MEGPSKAYDTRRKRRSSESAPKSRVDWKRTKVDTISHILDSDETTSEEEEEEAEQGDSTSISAEESEEQKTEVMGQPADEGEEDHIKKPRRKSKSATISSSNSSSDSDGPGTRVYSRRCCAIDEDEEDKEKNGAGGVESSEDEEAKAQIKKQKRKETLKQLAARRRSRNQTISSESGEEGLGSESTPESLDEEEDSQEMADFIEKDYEEDEDGNRLTYRDIFLKHHMAQFACDDLYSHLQKVIKAFVINIADNTFLETLYEGSRQKRYAKDMLKSLNYLDERVIEPRLEKLTTSCRWTNLYKERVNSYPHLLVRVIEAEEQSCEACKLKRYCKYLITLSGEAYHSDTLEKDDFLSDDKQMLVIGTTCAGRTEVYHPVKHYKYHLYQRCIPFLQESKDDSAKEIVEIALSKMEETNFIKEEVEHLERLLEDAEYFQPELLD